MNTGVRVGVFTELASFEIKDSTNLWIDDNAAFVFISSWVEGVPLDEKWGWFWPLSALQNLNS